MSATEPHIQVHLPATAAGMPWRPLRWAQAAAIGLLAVCIVVIAVPALPEGICTGDAGDLQLSATLLGIPHPPGYAAYVSLAHLATWAPGADPAYMVSLACMAVGTLVVVLAALAAFRMGVNIWVACAVALAMTSHSRFWQNLISPEVYIFSIAFLMGSVCSLCRYAATGRQWSLWLAAFLYGIAVANRPPVLAALPFFLAAWWVARRRWGSGGKSAMKGLVGIVVAGVLPACYSFAYLYLRDTPHARYNYVEQHNAETGELPDARSGPAAKVERVVWTATARQFHYRAGNTWKQVRAKLRWLSFELAGYSRIAPAAYATLVLLGSVVMFRRCPPAALALWGIMAQAALFILSYQDFGQAADLLPIVVPAAVFLATATIALFEGRTARAQPWLTGIAVAAAVIFTIRDVPLRPAYGRASEASAFLRTTELATFPRDSVILTYWTYALPLIYERELYTDRKDIEVVIAQPGNWLRMSERYEGRPVFVVRGGDWVRGRNLTPFRGLFLLGPPARSNGP